MWVRRVVLAPAIVVLTVVVLGFSPLILLAAAFAVRWLPGRWRGLRLLWFLLVYLVRESVGLSAMFVLWVLSGFGWKLRSDRFDEGARGPGRVVSARASRLRTARARSEGADRGGPGGSCSRQPVPCRPERGGRRCARVQPARRSGRLVPAGGPVGQHLRPSPQDRSQGPDAVRSLYRHDAQPAAQPVHQSEPTGGFRRDRVHRGSCRGPGARRRSDPLPGGGQLQRAPATPRHRAPR